MNTLDAMLTRTSQGKLGFPAPGPDILHQAFACALRAPDHRVLRPWRYLVIEGAGLQKLGDLFVAASLAETADLTPEVIERLQKMPLRAPMIVVAITVYKDDPKAPPEEQLLSTGAAVQNFLLALHDQGFASMWRSGSITRNPHLKSGLGVAAHESIAGFVYVGTASAEPRKITPLPVADFVSTWPG